MNKIVFENFLYARGFIAEYRFNPSRRWKFDYTQVQGKVAVEVEGGLWKYGRHNRAAGMIKDMEKYNWAALNGWIVLRYTPQDLDKAVEDIKRMMP